MIDSFIICLMLLYIALIYTAARYGRYRGEISAPPTIAELLNN